MKIGERIHRARKLRTMSLRMLGDRVGLLTAPFESTRMTKSFRVQRF